MKIIYVNCGLRNELESDLRGDEYHLSTSDLWMANSPQS